MEREGLSLEQAQVEAIKMREHIRRGSTSDYDSAAEYLDNIEASFGILPKQYCESRREIYGNGVIKIVISVGDSGYSEYEDHYYTTGGEELNIPECCQYTSEDQKTMERLFNQGGEPKQTLENLSELSSLESQIRFLQHLIRTRLENYDKMLISMSDLPGCTEEIQKYAGAIRAELPELLKRLQIELDKKINQQNVRKEEIFGSDGSVFVK